MTSHGGLRASALRRARDLAAAVLLGGALLGLASTPAAAQTEGQSPETPAPAPVQAPATPPPAGPPADHDSGSGEDSGQGSTDQPAAGEGTGHSHGKGHGYGGRALDPAPLETLPPDPAFPVPEPPVNENLPEEVDAAPPWQENVVCDPVDKPGLEAFGNLIGAHYGRPGYTTSRACIDLKSEHYDGRAIDWQLNAHDPADRRIADAVVTWLTDNDGELARRFGVQSIIWNHRVWHAYDDAGWRRYVGQSPHTDHIHFSFTWDGAMMRTSWWTGVAVEEPDLGPCKAVSGAYAAIPVAPRLQACPAGVVVTPAHTGYGDVRPGGHGAGVSLLQRALELPETGELDPRTREALIAWQTGQGIPATGVADQLTYAAALGWQLPELPEHALGVPLPEHLTTPFTQLKRTVLREGDTGEAVALLQEALGLEADGVFGPDTVAALEELTAEHPLLTESAETTTLTWHLLEQAAYPTLAYRHLVLERGAEGFVVRVLQEQLGVEADGKFGPITEGAVRAVQAEAGLEPTGVVDGPTWAAADRGEGVTASGTVDELGRTRVGGAILQRQDDLPTANE